MGYVSYPNPFLGYWKANIHFHTLLTNTHTYSMRVGSSTKYNPTIFGQKAYLYHQ